MDVVVVNYHTPADLQRFLQTLSKYPPTTPSTLTVVDVETSASERNITWRDMPATIIGTANNIGYGRACNLAAARGTDEVIALFNADIEVTPHSLDQCAKALVTERDWGILSPCQIDSRRRIRHAGIFGEPDRPVHRGWNEIHRGQYRDVRAAVTVSGSAFFVKRKVWEELTECPLFQEVAPDAEGAFLPTPHYYEETWACYHAAAHGYDVIYYGEATMVHKWHRASKVGGWAERQMPISRAIFRKACDVHGIRHD